MSKSEIEKIKAVLSDINEARDRATQGYWDENPATQEWKDNKVNNAVFIRLAANKITSLTKALEIAVDYIHDNYNDPAAQKALKQISEILEGK